jgi:hypothetical protein
VTAPFQPASIDKDGIFREGGRPKTGGRNTLTKMGVSSGADHKGYLWAMSIKKISLTGNKKILKWGNKALLIPGEDGDPWRKKKRK